MVLTDTVELIADISIFNLPAVFIPFLSSFIITTLQNDAGSYLSVSAEFIARTMLIRPIDQYSHQQ